MDKIALNGYMEDSRGRLVPNVLVEEIDMLRDDLVREVVRKATALSKQMGDFKKTAMNDINAFVSLSAEKYGVNFGGQKGNITLHTYNGEFRLNVAIAETLIFDERLHAAKELIDDCIRDWSQGSAVELQALINDAFDIDKTGNVNTKKILRLRSMKISDERWKKAMDAIGDSLQVAGSKAYLRVYKRQDDGEYKQINLDLAVL